MDFTDLYAFPKPGDAGKSILIMNAHPSAVVNPPGPTTTERFAPEALYELKIDTNGDAVVDITYQARFSSSKGGLQTATLRRVDGAKAAATDDGHALEHAGAYNQEEAIRVAKTLLPPLMRYDCTRPASYPENGRTLTDDISDAFLVILTNGKVTGDKVGLHTDLIHKFPYLGPPHD